MGGWVADNGFGSEDERKILLLTLYLEVNKRMKWKEIFLSDENKWKRMEGK